ncbi:MAG: hypothetical protein WDW38_008986 [Sanguina aurantia]
MFSLSLTYYICIFFELLYPAYASCRALSSPEPEDDIQWLTWWVVHAFMSVIEGQLESALQWVPLYYELKLVLILWMVAPQTSGAKVVFTRYIRPFLNKYASQLDPLLATTEQALKGRIASNAALAAERYGPVIGGQVYTAAMDQAAKMSAFATQLGAGLAAAAPVPEKLD